MGMKYIKQEVVYSEPKTRVIDKLLNEGEFYCNKNT